MGLDPNRSSFPQSFLWVTAAPVPPPDTCLRCPLWLGRGQAEGMTPSPAPTRVAFPQTGRPVLWRPQRGAVMMVMILLVGLFGVPPATPVAAVTSAGQWLKPVEAEVVDEFAAPPAPWAAGHRGIDLAGSVGVQIRAPADGTVSFYGTVVNRNVLSINHGAGYVSSFEPVESELEVGDRISGGHTIAELSNYDDGATHCDQPCLHWGVRHHGEYINPLLMTGELEPSVLLPLDDG